MASRRPRVQSPHGPKFKTPAPRQARISQDVLSKKANLAFHTIAKIEAGATPNPTIDTVKKIADALGVSLDVLMK
ncbi:MAG: helix-turn-helix transcriptional regulator [Parcubacteria group bacterium]|nr:helix-turn-helix transcriptional regulator [Parcubacteria group bacterium]